MDEVNFSARSARAKKNGGAEKVQKKTMNLLSKKKQ